MPYHVKDERQPICMHCTKPMSQWRGSDECPGSKPKTPCICNCPDSCGHKFDGPTIEFDEGRGFSVSCSNCGQLAMDHDIRVMP
jgi:hypothetical protein